MSEESQTLSELHDRAVSYLQQWQAVRGQDQATALLRNVAECYVDARSQFTVTDSDGYAVTDWKGRGGAYRTWVKSVLQAASITPEMRTTLQPAVAYHVSQILRGRLSEDELAQFGLDKRSYRDRRHERHEADAEIRRLFDPDTPADQLDFALLLRLLAEVVSRLSSAQRRTLLSTLLASTYLSERKGGIPRSIGLGTPAFGDTGRTINIKAVISLLGRAGLDQVVVERDHWHDDLLPWTWTREASDEFVDLAERVMSAKR